MRISRQFCVVVVVQVSLLCAVTAVPHAGICPVVNDTYGALCIDPPPCRVDRDCPRSKKCCFNGCSKLCIIPEKIDEYKAGLCKGDIPVDVGREWNPISNCSSTCSNDKHCAGDKKCCWVDECQGLACSEPAHEGTASCLMKVVVFSLIGVVVLCAVFTLGLFSVYRLVKKNNVTPQDRKGIMPQQNNMMIQDKAVEAGALPPKV